MGLQADLSKKEMEAKDLKKKLQDYEYRTEELSKDVEQLKGDYQVRKNNINLSELILKHLTIGAQEQRRRKACSDRSSFETDRRRVQRGTNSSYER